MTGQRKKIEYTISNKGCHICTSHHKNKYGYPILSKYNRPHNMHRVLFEEANGEIPKGLVVRHICDVRDCINLNHLILGTPKDNTQDITDRNRHNPPIGERSGTAKLSKEDIKKIRNSQKSQYTIAKQYGINQSQVSRIKNNLRWRHIL